MRVTRKRRLGGVVAAVLGVTLLQPVAAAPSLAAPVGQGFNLNASDLRFILKQIQIAEHHVANTTSGTGPCGALLGDGPNQLPNNGVGVTLPWGLRTVSGICNNLEVGQSDFGKADRKFPRLVPKKLRDAETGDPDGPGPAGNTATNYRQTNGTVVDSEPRTVSNLIVDQTAGNPAAVAAGGENPVVDARTGSIFIPNTAPDTGLSAPYNSWFTLFGQFFDHGLDLVKKGGNGTVFIPLKEDDPKFRPGAPTNFMVLTRATHGGDHEANNETSPFIDQSQTYTSHPSHQVFLREYAAGAGGPVSTGRMLTGPGDGMADWTKVKQQALTLLGIRLLDTDVTSVPLLATDAYGRFLRGPNGYPQLVVPAGADGIAGNADDGLVEGNPAAPVTTAGATKSGHAFLDDIAHHAVPTGDIDPTDGPNQVVPLAPDSDPGTTDDRNRATYDDEMLGAHFIAGDGRVNENIGLIAVHHVFHSEHNRLTGVLDGMIAGAAVTEAQRAAWRATGPSGWDYHERLFQAARFVTEMEYQHLAFEEFARKVQPMVNAFGEGGTGYRSNLDPAIKAEFAHAVYRFGHSMLNETVDRTTAGGTKRNIALLDAFLNPPAFLGSGTPNPDAAAGDIVRGMTRQIGNELDEFVTDALRNDLLGLPLDLATLNIARGRETGTPTLNEARRKFHAASADSALAPYTSWADFQFSLKHPESLANFIAAYGTHSSIEGASTRAGKRSAAQALLTNASDPDPAVSADAFAFLNSTGAYSNNANGVTTTGVDDIDLWVGGLAEKQMVFGGLLGPTFNYVFETQMEDLQDGDRFYYLSRTAGLNLLTQLEGNSFAELIQRNTDVEGLPADSFSRPDYVYNLANLGTSGPVPDDPTTEDWNESTQLTRSADGTIRYGGPAHVVFNGTPGNDRVHSSEGDDTVRGNDGHDRMEGGDGADNLIGGDGDDIMTDLFGDDTLKGGDGNDAMSSGRGFGGDLNQGGLGKDFVVGGNDITETFAGPGDDFVFAGDAEDTVFGDDGDDWIEGGKGPFNLLQGDNGAPFQDDLNEPGHDVLFSYGGEQDFDAEGGDDVMLLGPGIQRAEGMLGFDWTSHKNDIVAANSDMNITGLLPPTVDTNRDRFDLVEALSGWRFNDVLLGDSRSAADMAGHELTAAGIARVVGLTEFLEGATSFTGGNILMGGEGADVIEGRGGDDVIDGDAWLNVQLRAPNPATADPADFQLVDSMGAISADVFAGRIKPQDITIVRTVERTNPGTATDTARFSGPRENYTMGSSGGFLTVTDNTGTDGTDRLRNVETLQFSDQTVRTPGAPTGVTATPGNGSATVSWTAPAANGNPAVTDYEILVTNGATTSTVPSPGTATSRTIPLTNGTTYQIQVRALNQFGAGPASEPAVSVTPNAPAGPTVTARTPSDGGVLAVSGNVTATFSVPVVGANATNVQLRRVSTNALIGRTVGYNATTRTATLNPGSNLVAGAQYRVTLVGGPSAIRAATGGAPLATQSWTFTAANVPGPARIGTAVPGDSGGSITARANWLAPFSTGGSPVTGYRVYALRMAADGTTVLQTIQSAVQPPEARSLTMTLPQAGQYRFQVAAINAVGQGARSARSNQVAGR